MVLELGSVYFVLFYIIKNYVTPENPYITMSQFQKNIQEEKQMFYRGVQRLASIGAFLSC